MREPERTLTSLQLLAEMADDGHAVRAEEMTYLLDCLAEAAYVEAGPQRDEGISLTHLQQVFAELKQHRLWGVGAGMGVEGVESLLLSCLAVAKRERVDRASVERRASIERSGEGEEYWMLAQQVLDEVMPSPFPVASEGGD